MKAGLICLLTFVNLMSSCINRDKSFDGESFLVGTGACTVIHSDTLTRLIAARKPSQSSAVTRPSLMVR